MVLDGSHRNSEGPLTPPGNQGPTSSPDGPGALIGVLHGFGGVLLLPEFGLEVCNVIACICAAVLIAGFIADYSNSSLISPTVFDVTVWIGGLASWTR